jgi:hypothetical protein
MLLSVFHIVCWGILLQLLNDRLKMIKTKAMFARHAEFYICEWNEVNGIVGLFGARDE